MSDEMVKRIIAMQQLPKNKEYAEIIQKLNILLSEIGAVGFSAYLDNSVLKSSFYFNEEELVLNGIKHGQ